MRWKCPDKDCPPTDFEPSDMTTFDDDVLTAVCGSTCGKTYPRSTFRHV